MNLSGLVFAVLAVTACAATPVPPKTPWSVEVRTSGGFTGRGFGSFAVTSEGAVTIVKPDQTTCSFMLTREELQNIEMLLARTKRKAWKPSYAPENGCCDRYSYTLTVDEAGLRRSTGWITSPLPMPTDLVELANAIVDSKESIRAMADERCK